MHPSWRRRLRVLRKRLRRVLLTRPLLWLAARVVPPIYGAYMWLVWSTSRIESRELLEALPLVDASGGAVVLLWHEEVIAAPYVYYRLGLRPHTLVNRSDAGALITRVAERCHFVVFRGGSSSRRSRRRAGVFRDMIDHMNAEDGVLYGIAVDGSQGPPYRVKRGPLVIARECQKPIAIARVWFRRCLRMPSWDRVALPLPFNEIRIYARAPYTLPEDAVTKEGLERFRHAIEDEMIDLAALSYEDLGQSRPANLVKRPRPPRDADAEPRGIPARV
jgi:lysophospholipid acyltransferase (LPLAT)-like uncharacterized protein